MLKVSKVKRKSIAKALGVEVGDEIVAFDGYPCEDELDYLYYVEMGSFTMTVRDNRQKIEVTVDVEKESLSVLWKSEIGSLRTKDSGTLYGVGFLYYEKRALKLLAMRKYGLAREFRCDLGKLLQLVIGKVKIFCRIP